MPVTTPLALPTVATAGVVLLHIPPASVRVAVPPTQMLVPVDGLMAAGLGLTVTVPVTKQVPTV